MKRKKSPLCLAGRSRGYKSGYRTIANPDIKNNTPEKILDTVKKTGIADITSKYITSKWKVYTKEYIEQGKVKNLTGQNPFMLNRMITMKDGTKCPFVILPSDVYGAFYYVKCGTEKMAYYQIFSILINGEPDLLDDF